MGLSGSSTAASCFHLTFSSRCVLAEPRLCCRDVGCLIQCPSFACFDIALPQCPNHMAGRGSPASNNLDLLYSSSVTHRPPLRPYVNAPPAGSVCFLSTLLSHCLSEPRTATRPAPPLPPGRCLHLVRSCAVRMGDKDPVALHC